MVEVRGAMEPESQSWLDDWCDRLADWFGSFSREPDWVRANVEGKVTQWSTAAPRHVFTLTDAGEPVGRLALSMTNDPPAVMLVDLWVLPELRQRGYGRDGLAWAQRWAPQHGNQLFVIHRGGDPAQEALFGHLETRALRMMKPLTPNDPQPMAATGRAMRPQEYGPWRAAQEASYAEDIAGSGMASRAEAEAAAAKQFNELLPEGLETEGHSFLCVEVGGEVVATNWLRHGYAPATSFVYGVDVEAAHRRKGYGRVAMQLGEQASLQAGDRQLALNVFGQNSAAIGLYEAMGYGVVEKIRSVRFGA